MINRAVIILSGGKNTRMNGRTKAFLNINGERFIDNILKVVSDYEEKIISCNVLNKYTEFKGVKLIRDQFKEIGPIGGIFSSLKECNYNEALIVASDMPFLKKEVLNFLGNYTFKEDALVPIVNGKVQPLCSIYKKRILATIEEMIVLKDYKLMNLLYKIDVKYIRIEDGENFMNINNVNDYNYLCNNEKSDKLWHL
ncbi:MAG: molybdenum cofactor guanylyltransferase [Clostridium sp.]|uniref:molybdenum cofactor guanylyltransferase n=1 Tax=Clostridium sp. TaxID=1506 RepID=UPI003F3DF679